MDFDKVSEEYRNASINYNAAVGARQALWSLQDEAEALGGHSKRLIRLQDEQWEQFNKYAELIADEKRRIEDSMNPASHQQADDNVRHWRRELNRWSKHYKLLGRLETTVNNLSSDTLIDWRTELEKAGYVFDE